MAITLCPSSKKTAGPLHLGRDRGLHRGLGLRMAWLGLAKYQKRGLESLHYLQLQKEVAIEEDEVATETKKC